MGKVERFLFPNTAQPDRLPNVDGDIEYDRFAIDSLILLHAPVITSWLPHHYSMETPHYSDHDDGYAASYLDVSYPPEPWSEFPNVNARIRERREADLKRSEEERKRRAAEQEARSLERERRRQEEEKCRADEARAKKLLEPRYQEILEANPKLKRQQKKQNPCNERYSELKFMIGAVRGEWMRRYFEPRAEKVGLNAYNDWVLDYFKLPSKTPKLKTYDTKEDGPDAVYRALTDLKVFGLDRDTILLVPPNIQTEGTHKNTYRWNDSGPDATGHDEIPVYASTKVLLTKHGLTKQKPTLDDAELELRGATRPIGQSDQW